MSLPTIAPYLLPTEADLPPNAVAWTPDAARCALLIHDMQRYFVGAFPTGVRPATDLVANLGALRTRAAALDIPVIFTAQPGGQSVARRGLLRDFWGVGVPTGAPAQIIDELAPGEADLRVEKTRYSAFTGTALAEQLQAAGRDQLIVGGIYAHLGCLLTACDAFMHDIQPFLVADAVADFSPERHRMALRYATERCAMVLSTRQVLAALPDARGTGPEGGLTSDRVRADVLAQLDADAGVLDATADLTDLGLDSVRMMTLVEQWRQAGARIGFVDLAEEPTLERWARLVPASAPAGRSGDTHG